jgi:TolA-binding protein
LAGAEVHHTPLLVFTPAGELLLQIASDTGEDALLADLQRLLAEHPEFDEPSAEERAWRHRAENGERAAARELALNALARGRLDEAIGELAALVELLPAGREHDSAAYWLGRAHRLRGDPVAMEAAFAGIGDPSALTVELRLERAQHLRAAGRHAELRDLLAAHDLVESSDGSASPRGPRTTEALYLLALAHFELGDRERAEALWRALVQRYPEDGWVRRADWAVFELGTRGRTGPDDARSMLGRAYSGRPHPDLRR